MTVRLKLLIAIFSAGLTFAMLPPVGSGFTAAAASNQVLILGSSVSGGTSSLEAEEVVADGYEPVVVDDATWDGMTTAQFRSYRAIVIGDPSCDYSSTSIAAAVADAHTWGAAITGNTMIIGTDPVYHSGGTLSSGPGRLISHGIDFVVAQSGKTGAYVDLSCAYGDSPANTPATVLDGLGSFTVDGGPSNLCYDNAHIVASSPALGDLADSDLSNWSCSVHEAFDSWPASYTVLAVALDYGSAFTASDGTVGTPYILASSRSLTSTGLSVSPLTQTVSTGSQATVTAQLLDPTTNAPVSGQTISFQVSAGPNSGVAGTCVPANCSTDSTGTVKFSYQGTQTGADTIETWVDTNGDGQPSSGEPQTTTAVSWTAAQKYVALGDSYSAGDGVPPYISPDDGCHRSALAWPFKVNLDLGFYAPRFIFRACSGAIVQDLTTRNHEHPSEPPQQQWLGSDTKLVSLTWGGDNAHFADVMKTCVAVPCQAIWQSRVNSAITQMASTSSPQSLVKLYEAIAKRAPDATVVVLGYPLFFPDHPSLGCALKTLVTPHDMRWIDSEIELMDHTIQGAVARAVRDGFSHVRYVSGSDTAFAAHELCMTDPYLNGPTPSHVGISFHPDLGGNHRMAQLVEQTYK